MALQVMLNNQVLFSAGAGENVLVPFDDNERAEAFYALTSALAILSGITPQCPPAAMEGGSGKRCEETGQYHHGHKGGVVVPLRARSVVPTES